MKAMIIRARDVFEVAEVADPVAEAGQVIVAVDLCGVCGTDLHVLDGEHSAVTFPVIPGHEFVGRVVAHGPGVTYPPVGSIVAVDPMVSCGYCEMCRNGRTNLCLNGGGLGTTSDGGFAELVAVSGTQCEVLPAGLPVHWGAAIEPLACAVHAMDRLGPVLGDRVLVIGAGPVGLFLVRLLTLAGATVDLVERNEARLTLGAAFGAVRSGASIDDLHQPDLWHVVIDATGNSRAIEQGLGVVRRGGRFGVFGVADSAATIPLSPYTVFAKELTIVGSNSVLASFDRAARLLAGGAFPVDLLLSDPLPLERVGEAFDRTRRGEGFKSVVSPSGAFLSAGKIGSAR